MMMTSKEVSATRSLRCTWAPEAIPCPIWGGGNQAASPPFSAGRTGRQIQAARAKTLAGGDAMTGTFARAVVAASIAIAASAAQAAELKVFSTIGVQAALEELAPQFETDGGARLAVTWATAAMLDKRVEGGERSDCYVQT